MLEGADCIRPWHPDESGEESFPVRFAAPVDLSRLPPYLEDHPAWRTPLETRSRYGWIAASQAARDSGLDAAGWRNAAGLCARATTAWPG